MIKKIGVERRVHTAGKNKSTLDPFLEEKNEDIERLKNIQLDLHKDFINVDASLLRDGDPTSIVSDPILIKENLSWRAKTSFEVMIKKIIEFKIKSI